MTELISSTPAVIQTFVVEKGMSAAEKVLELPMGSVIFCRRTKAGYGGGLLNTVLHRTGPKGWMITRATAGLNGGTYLSPTQVSAMLDRFEADGATFHFAGSLDG